MDKNRRIVGGSVALFAAAMGFMFWVYLANLFGIISLPDILASFVRDFGIVLGGYLATALFVSISANRVIKLLIDIELEQRLLLGKLYTWVAYIVATTIVLFKLGVSFEHVGLSISLLATGVAFAIRDVLISYIAWFVLLVKKPFRIGDCIQIGENEGRVVHIGTFYVALDEHSHNRNFVKVPNKVFLERPIRNFGHETARFSVTLPLAQMQSERTMNRIEKSLKRIAGEETTILLSSDTKRLSLQVEYTTIYENRDLIRDRIIRKVEKEKK